MGGKVSLKLTEVNGQTTSVYKGNVIFFVLKDALIIIKDDASVPEQDDAPAKRA